MTEGGFYQPKRFSPTGIAIVALVHAAAIAALALSKMEMPSNPFHRTVVRLIPLPPQPKPLPPKPHEQPRQEAIFTMPPQFPQPPKLPPQPPVPDRAPSLQPTIGTGEVVTPPPEPPPPLPPPPKADPVRTEAKLDGGATLQPPYPASAQRLGLEGTVQVRVVIGPDGRVKTVEKVRATSDEFFAATKQHALRSWRFKPATIDGRPIESSKVLTVRFELNG